MEIKEMSFAEIEQRMTKIRSTVETKSEELAIEEMETLTKEIDALEERKIQLNKIAEERAALIEKAKTSTHVIAQQEERKVTQKMEDIYQTPEYRSAWLNKMRGVKLTEEEQRAFTGSAAIVPASTANKIIDQLVDAVPLMNEIDLTRFKGNISVAVQSAAPAPTLKAGGAAVDEATTTLLQVSLGSYTLSALVSIGADVSEMAIDAFEGWLISKLIEQLAYKIEYYIIKGTGDSQPKGIDAITYVDGTNAVDWASTALGSADIDEAIGLLPAAYDGNAKFLMSKKTFYTSVVGLQDVNNYPLVVREGANFLLRGFPVKFSDQVDAGDVFFGDFKRGMVGNLSNDMKVEMDRNLRYNAWDYLGWCSFDCKPSGVNCIIKIASDI
jgi:HK97 family phage major capsid protein